MRNLSLVNEFCTCGARLPEDARFCHKCGKPQRDEPEIEALSAESVPPVVQSSTVEPAHAQVAAAEPRGIGFRNPAAVKAALISSALATLAGILPLFGPFQALWQLLSIMVGGFASVYFYQRRTGDYLSVRAGLQIGWMTGLFCFLVIMVMLTALLAIVTAVGEAGLRQLSAESGRPEFAEAFESMLSNPAMLVFALVTAFFFMTVLGSAGGALGSKILERE